LRYAILIPIAAAISVESRFAILGILIVVVGKFAIEPIVMRRLTLSRLAFVSVGLVVAVGAALYSSTIFKLNDLDRGTGTGLTGRTELWEYAVEDIKTDPLGYGFKNSYDIVQGHNSYLALPVQFGVLPSIFIVCAFLLQLSNMCRDCSELRKDRSRRASAESVVNLTIGFVALLIAGFFQPQMINFGDTIGVLFVFLISRPSLIMPRRLKRSYSAVVSARIKL
jgi:O-antigen ligase